MTIKLKGSFGTLTGAMSVGDLVPAASTGYRYWRLEISSLVSNIDLIEIEMFEETIGGVDVTSPAYAFADSFFDGRFIADYAFNNTTNTADAGLTGNRWNSSTTGVIHHIGQDFGDGNEKDIKRVEVLGGWNSGGNWNLQYSDDDISYTTVVAATSIPAKTLVTITV